VGRGRRVIRGSLRMTSFRDRGLIIIRMGVCIRAIGIRVRDMPLANIFIWMALLYKGYLIIMHIRNHE
jgi:hypothetical protein